MASWGAIYAVLLRSVGLFPSVFLPNAVLRYTEKSMSTKTPGSQTFTGEKAMPSNHQRGTPMLWRPVVQR
ncbi:uncharacterized protein [Blastocystis hominis]|uniref:Uncharacterized protein n=1 Tax=Blastocystis hominis TaxID=12968 RepID=D8M688_BLAHO|nr:uncharacterized protein [Blastocystis hominis]CBK23641.2 unnamed protein product [Blastocystis hominis]|eukprot:XP_012897689.1 uncharacterized protein [Blastocystis hominis]